MSALRKVAEEVKLHEFILKEHAHYEESGKCKRIYEDASKQLEELEQKKKRSTKDTHSAKRKLMGAAIARVTIVVNCGRKKRI